MDFVVGIEIKLSNNHTVNGMPLTDICDTLKGRYPKDFKFVGWHPHCRCHVVTILKTEEEMMRDTQRILNGEQPLKGSVNTVKSVPSAFKDWVEEHSERIEKGGKLPYFIADNRKRVNKMLGIVSGHEEGSLIRLGDQEWTVDELIGECRIEPTENGKIYVHPDHGESELAENLEFARWRAEQFGEEVILLPNPQNIKSPDSYNITRGVQEEYKRSSTPTKNSIDRLIRDGSKQANHIVLAVDSDITPRTLQSGIKGRVVQNSEIKELRIRIGNAEAVYSRESIIAKDFKIKPEDFHDVSIFRSEADRPIERPADAKLAKFFGLNKKSPKEIALERHAKRDVAKIQQAWNERRISNLAKAVKDGYLPKESISGLSELKQDAFNTRVSALQKAANRHAARSEKTVNDIKERWEKKQKRDATTRLMAKNVLKVAQDCQEVDFSVLQEIISDNNLGAMRAEAKRVAQAIKVIRDEEKALSDLIPDTHGWHKTFSLSELKEAHGKIQSTLDYWKDKGYDLATDSNLDILKKELEQKIKFVENPGAFKAGLTAHKTWEVQQKAYQELLNKVETRIELISLEAEYQSLLGFSTTSKDFKHFMTEAKAAIDAGNVKTAKSYLASAKWKKSTLEHRRKGKTATSAGISFAEMPKEKIEKLLLDFHTNTVHGVDKELREWMESEWGNLTYEEQKLLTRYTQAYTYLNDRLRGLPPSSWIPQSEYNHDMPIITQALNKLKVPRDMVVRRGTGNYEIKAIGKWLSEVEEGDVFTEPAFLSTSAHRDKGFFKNLEMVIVVPKGARGAFAEPFSHYNDSCSAYDYDYDRIWDGKTKQSIEDEFEWIGQRGCQFKVLQKTGNRIILQLIGQLK